jgi:hypothetical protein
MTATSMPAVPDGTGSLSQAPNLPAGFTDTFTSGTSTQADFANTWSSAVPVRHSCLSTAGRRTGTPGGS